MLLAAPGWIEAIAPLVFVVIWLLRALMAEKQQPPPRPPVILEPDDEPPVRQQRPRAREPEVIVMGPNQGRPPAGDLRSEVEDFLRRVGEMRTAPEPQPKPPKPQAQSEQPKRVRQKPTPANRPAARKESDSEPNVSRGATVADHVQQHVGHLRESQLAEQAARLGADLAQTDERLEQRLQQKFDHKVGTLSAGTLAKNPGATVIMMSPAQEIAAMLARPDSMRNAVVLGEIMKRPSDDW